MYFYYQKTHLQLTHSLQIAKIYLSSYELVPYYTEMTVYLVQILFGE